MEKYEKMKPCPFCGVKPVMGKVGVAFCKTEGCFLEHRAIDLDFEDAFEKWQERA